MEKFIWIEKDYKNRSLNNLAKNITEYNTSMLINRGFEVNYGSKSLTNTEHAVVGTLFVMTPLSNYTVEDLEVLNMLSDYNIYFKYNTEDLVNVREHKGTYDCLVSLAAGDISTKLPDHIGGVKNHYIVDISSTAIKKSNEYFRNFFETEVTDYQQLDFFNIENVKEFLSKIDGTKGLFVVSNCFCYAPTSLFYDTEVRLRKQNEFIELLANDKIDWYVDIVTADGVTFRNVSAKTLLNHTMTDKLKVLPWI
jgi:hypothetical protein